MPGSSCVACGGSELVAWPAGLDRLRENEIVGVGVGENPKGWGCLGMIMTVMAAFALAIVSFLAVLSLTGSADLAGACCVLGYGAGLLGGYLAQWRRLRMKRQPRLAAAPERHRLPAARETRVGRARPHQRKLQSLVSSSPCLGSAVIARRDDGRDVCERVESADFWLDGSGSPILICGVVSMRGAGRSVSARAAQVALGVELKLELLELLVKTGARVTVEGTVTEEQLPELGYRGGSAQVMRGVPGAPVEIRVH